MSSTNNPKVVPNAAEQQLAEASFAAKQAGKGGFDKSLEECRNPNIKLEMQKGIDEVNAGGMKLPITANGVCQAFEDKAKGGR